MKPILLLLLPLQLLGPLLLNAQSDVQQDAAAASQALVKGHVAWRDKLSSPGVSVRVKEVERKEGLVRYNLYVSGLPTDQTYTVLAWPVTQGKPAPIVEGVSMGNAGIVMCAGRTEQQCGDPSKKDDPVDFTFNPAKGEPYRLALVSGEYRAAVVIVPDPITTRDKGCSFSVERLLPHFELAYFTGNGFPPDAQLSFVGDSYGEKHTITTKTDNAGNLQFALMPFVSGHQKGTTPVKGTTPNCSPSIKFDWGS